MTEEDSRIYMMLWDERFLTKVRKLGIHLHLYKRYVDDILALLNAIRSGWSYNKPKNRMEFTQDQNQDDSEGDQRRTMRILREIADTIDENIQFTTDTPVDHQDAKMPVLDIKVWIDTIDDTPVLLHTFYKKPVASRYTILAKSAMGKGVKRNTLFQEAIRRLKNISPSLPWSEAIPHMEEFGNMLRISGYSQEYRHNIIKGAVDRMKEVRAKVARGEWTSQYRDREAIVSAKEARGGFSKGTWFLKGETTTTLTCAATPGSILQDHIKTTLKAGTQADGGQTMVLEDGGAPATMGLKVKDPFRVEECRFKDKDCNVTTTTDCSQQDKTYIITCKGCPTPIVVTGSKPNQPGGEGALNYIGTTGTSMHTRSKAHAQSIKYKHVSNAMAKHTMDKHQGVAQGFTMKPIATHRTVLARYKAEGVYIERQAPGTTLNSKAEGGRGGLVRLTLQINRC